MTIPTKTLLPYGKHAHHSLLEKMKSRDFHKVVIEIYKNIPDEEKDLHVDSFNKLIQKWHYTPAEAWNDPDMGIWSLMGLYLNQHFSDIKKYNNLAEIFNNI